MLKICDSGDHAHPNDADYKQKMNDFLGVKGVEIVADATGVPDAIPTAMSLACDAGQVVVVGSPRGKAKDVNFYDDLHRRYIEVSGAHGNMLFEPAHHRLAGAWTIDKAQRWLLASLAGGRLSLDGLITHRIVPEQLGEAYEGLLKNKEQYLSVVLRWNSDVRRNHFRSFVIRWQQSALRERSLVGTDLRKPIRRPRQCCGRGVSPDRCP